MYSVLVPLYKDVASVLVQDELMSVELQQLTR